MSRPVVLVVDDERGTREGLERALQDRSHVLAQDAVLVRLLRSEEHTSELQSR